MADKYGIQFVITPIDNEALKASPVPSGGAKLPVFGMPGGPNCSAEVLSVSVGYNGVIPVDGTDAITTDLTFYDASAAAATVLKSAFNLKSTNASHVLKTTTPIWKGNQRMDYGDVIYAPLTITTPDTAGEGGFFVTAYRIKEWNGE